MVLRAGYKTGPARPWDVAAAVAGVLLVAILFAFVVAAGTRPHYSHLHDTISALGAYGAPGRWWFSAVNWAGAALIVVFAHGVQRRLAVGLATTGFLSGVAVGAVLVGAFPCRGQCRLGTSDAHGLAADFTAVMIFGFLAAAAWARRRRPRRPFSALTLLLAAAAFVLLVLLVVAGARHWGDAGLLERLFWASAYVWVLIASAGIVAATRRRARPAPFDPSVLQPKIVRSPQAWTHAAYLTAAVIDPATVAAWLAAVTDPTAGLVRPDDGTPTPGSVTLAFSAAGMARLGVAVGPGADQAEIEAFLAGMGGRSDLLGDAGPSAPDNWQDQWQKPHDVLMWVEAAGADVRDGLVRAVQAAPGARGLDFHLPAQLAEAGAHGAGPGRGPLRFRDGISQPWLPLAGREPDRQEEWGGALDPFGEWRPLAVGEFVLGEVDELGDTAPVPEPADVFHHGSFVVVRKLAQDFAALGDLDARMRDRSTVAPLGGAGPDFTERMMGRTRDGDPLVTGAAGINAFTYASDPSGLSCPLGAHARRANPRDALGFGTAVADRHRILRRGKPYAGDPAAPEGWRDGLVFVAVVGRIADQFEFVQRLWLGDGARARVGTTPDLFAARAAAPGRVVLQTEGGPVVTEPIGPMVTTMGGGYFFAPSMAGLEALARRIGASFSG